jgi:hypothetical protein
MAANKNKINVNVIVERREYCKIDREMVQYELEGMDELERCCDDSEAMSDLVDIIFERIVEHLKTCGSTLNEDELGWGFGGGDLDEGEVVRYLIKQVYDEDEPILCGKCWENK